VASGQAEKECLWTRLHNRSLEIKERRRKAIKLKYKYQPITSTDLDKKYNRMIEQKEQILHNFTDQYLEDLLIQNCYRANYIELAQILIPKRSKEPYRNVKNFGLLLDLEKIFGESKTKLMSKNAPSFKYGAKTGESHDNLDLLEIKNDEEEGDNVLDNEHNFVRKLKNAHTTKS